VLGLVPDCEVERGAVLVVMLSNNIKKRFSCSGLGFS
jgi:hypothetical protein